MERKIKLGGEIFFRRGEKSKVQRFDFQISIFLHSFAETLMNNFSGLKFGREEKRLLTQEARQKIQQFRGLNSESPFVEKEVDKLIKKLAAHREESLHIWANGLGAYLCLAAIVSGRLPEKNRWQFKLDSIPLALFPASLVKDKRAMARQKVEFTFERNCWPHPFKKLYQIPKHLKSVGLNKIQICGHEDSDSTSDTGKNTHRLRKAA